jgi:hypothetical protein
MGKFSADRIREVDKELPHIANNKTLQSLEVARENMRKPLSEETRKKISEAKKGKLLPPSARKRMSYGSRVARLNKKSSTPQNT